MNATVFGHLKHVARLSLLAAGLPVSVPGQTIDRQCSSGLMAIAVAARQIIVDGLLLRLVVCNDKFVHRYRQRVVATLLDEGRYLCSERTMYRFLGAEQPVRERRNQLSHPHYAKPELLATAPNQVWACDICYIPMAKGFMYLVAIMDWYSRRVLSWRVSNTLDTDFCIEALEDALQCFAAPEIFNSDQGAQFTSEAFTDVLNDHGIAISMDGKGRWLDNVFVERLWRSVKYEDVYLRAYETPAELRAGLARYFEFYNSRRRHSALGRRTPVAVYYDRAIPRMAA